MTSNLNLFVSSNKFILDPSFNEQLAWLFFEAITGFYFYVN
ncbi:hypothetical protein PPAR_a2328 [Pseudoalteromonas paragorgicola KMM 3548]|nr:hypothetical protein [Pseudoalteromonas distincta KMM 3548]MBE3674198.1 hypothetical protein [Pseudoalteromonas distincta KMM 3548]